MKKKIASDHFKNFKMLSHLKREGDKVYFISKQANLEDNRYDSDLYCLENGKVSRLTSSKDVGSYEFMDGGIIFPCLREKKDREKAEKGIPLTVYQQLTPGMGEAAEWLRLGYRVQTIKFLDKDHFFFIASYDARWEKLLEKNGGDSEKAAQEVKDNAEFRVFEEIPFWMNGAGDTDGQRARLYYYACGEVYPMSAETENIAALELNPSKTTLAYTVSDFVGKERMDNFVMTVDVAAVRALEGDRDEAKWRALGVKHDLFPGGMCYGVQFMSDTEAVAVICRQQTYGLNENAAFFRWNLKTGECTMFYNGDPYTCSASEGSDCRMGTADSDFIFDETGIIFISTVVNHTPLIHVGFDGSVRELTGMEMVMEVTPDDDGFTVIAMVGDDGNEIYHVSHDGKFTALTSLNAHLTQEYEVVTPKEIHYVNENGLPMVGWVIEPVGREEGKKYPTILDVHGGPKTVYGPHFFHEMQQWANEGFAVIFTNPTGGDGRGNEFMDIRGKYGTVDFRDLMIFCDEAIKACDFIDADRMGVIGGSYGGFMTNWIIGHTDRFKAAVSLRSIANWVSFANTTDIGWYFSEDQNAATPWGDQAALWEHSPLKYADRVKTPTLFLHADEDTRCWMVEGIQMFYALRYFGVESRLVLFNRETHELSRSGRPKSRIRRNNEIVEWFRGHLM